MCPNKKTEKNKLKRVLICMIIVIPCVTAMYAGGATLITAVNISKSFVNPISVICIILACYLSGFFCLKYLKTDGIKNGAIIGVSIYLPIFIYAVSSGQKVGLAAIYKLIMCLCAGAMGGCVSVVMSGKRSRTAPKKR